jgi:hypothetical protein
VRQFFASHQQQQVDEEKFPMSNQSKTSKLLSTDRKCTCLPGCLFKPIHENGDQHFYRQFGGCRLLCDTSLSATDSRLGCKIKEQVCEN